jgi:hypothetical protein
METKILLTGLLFFLIALFILAWLLIEWGKRGIDEAIKNEEEFNNKVAEIEVYIKKFSLDMSDEDLLKHHRSIIEYKITRLKDLKYRSKEKTSTLWCNYARIFYKFEDEPNEFDLGMIDYERAEKRVAAINNFRK